MLPVLSSVLACPVVYLGYQKLVGGIRARRLTILDHVERRKGLVVIDIGCGPGYVLDWLPGTRYYGFDTSPQYIDYARRRFGAVRPEATFFCDQFRREYLSKLPKADFVLMMGLLHHLDDDGCRDVLQLSRDALRPGGRLITLDGCRKVGQSRLARYILDSDRGRYVRDEDAYVTIARSVFPEVKPHYRPELFLIPHPSLVMDCVAG